MEDLTPRMEEQLRAGGIMIDKYQQHIVPVNSIKHYQYYCILVEGGSKVLANGKYPIFFHKDVFDYARNISLENKGRIARADRTYIRAKKSGVNFLEVYIIIPRKKKKLSKKELAKRRLDALKANANNNTGESNPTDMEVSSVQGGEHQSVSGEQTAQVHELHSNNNTQQNKGDQ